MTGWRGCSEVGLVRGVGKEGGERCHFESLVEEKWQLNGPLIKISAISF